MALTKIHGWKGEAEILGGLYEVEFELGVLTIKGLDLDGGYAVLEALAAKTIVGARVKSKTPLVEQPPESKPPSEVKKDSTPWDPKVEFPEESNKPALVVSPPPEERASKPAEPVKELVMEEEKLPPKPEVGGVPPEIQNAPNVISVLDWLVKTKGIKASDAPAMVAAAKEIAPHVGLLRRMGAKLPERITSTLQMFAEGGV